MTGRNALEDAWEGRRVAVIGRTLFDARDRFHDTLLRETRAEVVRSAGIQSIRVPSGGTIQFFSLASPEALRGRSFDSVYATSTGVAARILRDPLCVSAVLASAPDPRFGVLS